MTQPRASRRGQPLKPGNPTRLTETSAIVTATLRARQSETLLTMLAQVFAVGIDQDGIILTVGQISPPLLLGTPDQQLKEAQQIREVPVNILGRFIMSPARARELSKALDATLKKMNEMADTNG